MPVAHKKCAICGKEVDLHSGGNWVVNGKKMLLCYTLQDDSCFQEAVKREREKARIRLLGTVPDFEDL